MKVDTNQFGSSLKTWYIIFLSTVTITIIGNGMILDYNLGLQDRDGKIINLAGRQRMLSQRLAKYILYPINGGESGPSISRSDSLVKYSGEFIKAQKFLTGKKLVGEKDELLDSLINDLNDSFEFIVNLSNMVVSQRPEASIPDRSIEALMVNEHIYVEGMEKVVTRFQKNAELKLRNTKRISIVLSVISLMLLIGEFIFLIIPIHKNLSEQNHKLAVANRKLNDFSNITSHNLRGPLANLRVLLGFLKNTKDREDRIGLVKKLEIVSGNMDRTMNTLLDSLSYQRTVDKLIREAVFFENVLQNVKENLSSQIEESGAEIYEDFNGADKMDYPYLYLESILQNLMTNSLKYRSPERPLKISITTIKKRNKIILRHTDNGLGLDMDKYGEKLFGLNQIFHKHNDSKGVGLYMTRIQVEALGGEIEAFGEPDKGMSFVVEF